MKNLYHGSTSEFLTIDLSKGKGFKDFGKGFYTTSVKNHAERIAKRNRIMQIEKDKSLKIKRNVSAYVYNLEFDDNDLSGLNVKVFKKPDIEWVKFVIYNREREVTCHNFDIVIGPTADENTVTILNNYKGLLRSTNYSNEVLYSLIKELKPENLPKQYFFATQRALKKLKFKPIRRELIQ